MGLNPVGASEFFWALFHSYGDLFHFYKTSCSFTCLEEIFFEIAQDFAKEEDQQEGWENVLPFYCVCFE